MHTRPVASVLSLLPLFAMVGCATEQVPCKTGYAMSVYPAVSAADSSGKAPANQAQFQAGVGVVIVQQGSGSCVVNQLRQGVHPQWTSADPDHITISSADDSTNGQATCTGPTSGAVTLTATLPAGSSVLGSIVTAPLTAMAELTCK